MKKVTDISRCEPEKYMKENRPREEKEVEIRC